ncbi:MAG: hypothetical protein Q8P59_12710, partial [Dehalococcoidia bacterium]|nr:hypothetical protein [Dehalococcoidia bacterium]
VEIEPPAVPVPQEVEAALAAGITAKGLPALEERPLPEVVPDLTPTGAAQELQQALYEISNRMVPRVRDKASQVPALGLYHIVTSRASLLKSTARGPF